MSGGGPTGPAGAMTGQSPEGDRNRDTMLPVRVPAGLKGSIDRVLAGNETRNSFVTAVIERELAARAVAVPPEAAAALRALTEVEHEVSILRRRIASGKADGDSTRVIADRVRQLTVHLTVLAVTSQPGGKA